MGPDPFSMPGFGSPSAAQNSQALTRAVGQMAPLATQFHGPLQGIAPQQVFNQPSTPVPSGVLSKFTHFIGGIGSEIGHISGQAASWLGKQTVQMATAVPHFVTGITRGKEDSWNIQTLNALNQQSSDILNTLNNKYKTGQINKSQYQDGLKQVTQLNTRISQQQDGLQSRIKADQNYTTQAAIDTASAVITVMTAGLGKVATAGADALPVGARAAANFLSSHAPSEFFSGVENGINKLATNPGLFEKLAPQAQKAIQSATAEVIASNTNMTAQQIARTAAVNLALKYPIYYNMLSTQGQQIYQKLDNKQYGSAIRQVAFNAALLLSGGPIGQALKYGEKFIGGVVGATFGRTAFLDELSKGIGNGAPDGLFNAINKLPEAERQSVIKVMSNVEATNMGAVAGKDPVAAAWRVLNGMSSYEGLSMSQFTHEEALSNMVNFAKAQQLVDEIGKARDLGPITVGRVDARALNTISANLSPINNVEDRLNAWDALKGSNPTQAWANNENFDRQIKSLIMKHEDATSLDAAIRGIQSSFTVKGFPEAQAKELSKMGYIPIKPVNLEAPFQEGTGKLASKFADNNNFFERTVQPLPVLGSIGSLLTNMGLSPTASTSRVYQIFNRNLADNISKLNVVGNFYNQGENTVATADNIVKKLSEYAHDPVAFRTENNLAGRGIAIRGKTATPITDLRQMTTRDIQDALGVTRGDAVEVKGALMDSMLQVPLQVRGLGDKIVDVNYKINPLAGRYARIQGGARFAWNPFFQAKLAYKTELLAQSEAGGKFPTLGGTNTILSVIFPDKYRQIDNVTSILRNAGALEEKAAVPGEFLSGEAVNDVGIAGANLTHKLTPSQERSIASLVSRQADRVGSSVEDFVKYFPNDVRNTVQMIAQYDRNSVFLNSAMARTLNLAFFPFRFEYKVASIMARSLGRTNLMTQLAVINGLYKAHDFLNSPEGQAWYSKNSEVIGLFKYFTPVQTLAEVGNLLGGHPDSVGSFGELGGLPFGWLPQLLDAEGLTHFGGGYVSPKTGEVIPNYVPATDKGALLLAIQDLIGSLYSYPGATAGMPSKTTLDRNIAVGITGANKKTDLGQVTPGITPAQQNFSDAIKATQQVPPEQQNQNIPKNQQPTPNIQSGSLQPGVNVPRLPSPIDTTPGKQSSSKSKKLKKSQFIPQLLPGQSSLGQL